MEKEANSDNVQTRPVQCNGAINLVLVPSWTSLRSGVWPQIHGGNQTGPALLTLLLQSMYMHVIGNIVYVYKREEVDTQLSGIETV